MKPSEFMKRIQKGPSSQQVSQASEAAAEESIGRIPTGHHKPGEPILCGSADVSRYDSLYENTVRARELVIQLLREASERMDPNQDYVFEARLVAK